MTDPEPFSIRIEAGRPEDLFESAPAPPPYTGRRLHEETSDYAITLSRTHPKADPLVIDLAFAGPTLAPGEEARLRAEWTAHFDMERARVDRAAALNQVEGRRALWVGLIYSAVAIAILVPIRLYIGSDLYFIEFLLVIGVWVLLWDAIEMLLFDSIFLRTKRRAIDRLRRAQLRVSYRSPTSLPPATAASGTGQI